MEWFSSLLYHMANLFPRLIHITEDIRGVKLKRGTHKRLEPGYSIYWPLFTEIRTCCITRQELDLPEQILTTLDGRTVVASVSIVYRIHGVIKALIGTQNYETTVMEVAQRAVKYMVSSNPAEYSINHNEDFDKQLMKKIQKDVLAYGLKIDDAFLTSCAMTTPIHITGIIIPQQVL